MLRDGPIITMALSEARVSFGEAQLLFFSGSILSFRTHMIDTAPPCGFTPAGDADFVPDSSERDTSLPDSSERDTSCRVSIHVRVRWRVQGAPGRRSTAERGTGHQDLAEGRADA